MFTGLVREVGTVASFEQGRLVVEASTTAALGDSVAIDGVCLTVVGAEPGRLSFDVVPETSSRVKAFGRPRQRRAGGCAQAIRSVGTKVQATSTELGGSPRSSPRERASGCGVELEPELGRYCVEKGSITLDGVSLTVASLGVGAIEAALIPHTLAETTLSDRTPGDLVNVEVDVLAKYAERLARPAEQEAAAQPEPGTMRPWR